MGVQLFAYDPPQNLFQDLVISDLLQCGIDQGWAPSIPASTSK